MRCFKKMSIGVRWSETNLRRQRHRRWFVLATANLLGLFFTVWPLPCPGALLTVIVGRVPLENIGWIAANTLSKHNLLDLWRRGLMSFCWTTSVKPQASQFPNSALFLPFNMLQMFFFVCLSMKCYQSIINAVVPVIISLLSLWPREEDR